MRSASDILLREVAPVAGRLGGGWRTGGGSTRLGGGRATGGGGASTSVLNTGRLGGGGAGGPDIPPAPRPAASRALNSAFLAAISACSLASFSVNPPSSALVRGWWGGVGARSGLDPGGVYGDSLLSPGLTLLLLLVPGITGRIRVGITASRTTICNTVFSVSEVGSQQCSDLRLGCGLRQQRAPPGPH